MKRIVFFFMLLLILCGCAVAPPNLEKPQSNHGAEIDMGIQTRSPQPKSTISSQEKRDFYKIQVANKDLNIKKMMELVHGKKQLNLFKKEKKGRQIGQIDGVKHTWEKTENNGILYTNDRSAKEPDKKKARQEAQDFIERFNIKFNLSFSKDNEKKDEDGSYTFCYIQTWDGIKVMGNKTVYLPDNDEKPIHGSYIEVNVDETGIASIFLQQVFDVKKKVKSYQTGKDLIAQDKIVKAAKKHYENLYADLKETARMAIQDVAVIYMPYKENNTQYFIPVYEIAIGEKGRKESIYMLMDAVTAYVYYAQ